MKTLGRISVRLALAAGAMVALAALPQSASAQLLGGLMRPGAVGMPGMPSAASAQAGAQMRPGPVVRGASPVYSQPPVYSRGPIYNRGPVYSPAPSSQGPIYSQPPVSGRQPFSGPVVTLRESPSSYNYSNNSTNNYNSNNYNPLNYGGDGDYGRRVYLPPVGPGNGFIPNQLPPVGPEMGFSSVNLGQPDRLNNSGRYCPPLLGGYYYNNYCDINGIRGTYPSVYSGYDGFPQYIYSSNVVVSGDGYAPAYAAPVQTFNAPTYQTIYNQNNYYVASEGRVADLEAGGARAKEALRNAYPANSFQAAFADIAQAWTDGNLTLLRRHLRDSDTRISVSLGGKYAYSIASGDFSQITRDALDRLHTVSFDFTRLRKAKNGDVTAFGAHVYRVDGAGANTETNADGGGTIPFDQAGTDGAGNSDGVNGSENAGGAEKTVYVSYTLRRHDGEWYIVATDSADFGLATPSK